MLLLSFFSSPYKFKPFHHSQTNSLQITSSFTLTSSLFHFSFPLHYNPMMHHCCNTSSTCTCCMFHPQTNSNSNYFFSNYQQNVDHYDFDSYSYTNTIPSSSVDCTLSLATPSTRLSEHQDKHSNSITNFLWNKNKSKNVSSNSKHYSSQTQTKSNRGNNGNDSLLARRCASCDTTSTPLWRNGPRGPKSLCNACGIRYKKEERRANAASATSAVTTGETGHVYGNNNSSWYGHQQSHQMYGNELRFMEDAECDSENGIPNFMSWRLNTSVVHDYTR